MVPEEENMRHKGDIQIGVRAAEEMLRLYPSQAAAAKAIHRERKIFNMWQLGHTPDGASLAAMYYCGADVIYILTEKRARP